jgi:hypothetical protein
VFRKAVAAVLPEDDIAHRVVMISALVVLAEVAVATPVVISAALLIWVAAAARATGAALKIG